MPKKSLRETNPHLKNPKRFRELLIRNVATSAAIEADVDAGEIAGMLSRSGKGNSPSGSKRRRASSR
jgi:hypothetical protein